MQVQMVVKCPKCVSDRIVRNDKKANGKQLYKCRDCNRQFIDDHEKTYKDILSTIANQILIILARGSGVRDIVAVLSVSIYKVHFYIIFTSLSRVR